MGRRMFFWRNNIHPSRGKTKGYIAGRNRRRWIILFFLHEILLADFVCIILLIACRLCFTRIVVASKYVWKKKGKKSSSSSSLIDVSSSSSCVAERMCSWLRESTNPRVAYFILFFVFFFPGPCAETFKSENETADQLDSTHIATYSLCVCVCVCVCGTWYEEERSSYEGSREGGPVHLFCWSRPGAPVCAHTSSSS
jgi:hypothetical protein